MCGGVPNVCESIALYGAETWRLRKVGTQIISYKCGAGEGWRKISWTDRVRNEEVCITQS